MRKLVQTLSAVGMLVCFGQFEAFGSDHSLIKEDDANEQQSVMSFSNQQPQPTDVFPKEILKVMLADASSGTHPIDLQLVCTSWRNVIRENKPLENDIKFAGLNPFMKTCMNVCWSEKYNNAVLRYTDLRDAANVIDQKFRDVPNGTFDISKCGGTCNLLRMTQSADEFLQVGGDNKDKIIILFAERQMIERLTGVSAEPFVKILEGWDPSYPFGIFWRWDNANEYIIDYLTNASARQISLVNIFKNWQKSKERRVTWVECNHWYVEPFNVYFVNPN